MSPHSRLLAATLTILLGSCLSPTSLLANDIAEIPDFMGDWSGEWTNPKGGYYRNSFKLMARVIGKGDNIYEVQFVEEFDKRVRPYLVATARAQGNTLVLQSGDWNATFSEGVCKGAGIPIDGELMEFELRKIQRVSPTKGQEPPADAIVLYDGSGLDAWGTGSKNGAVWKIQNNGDLVSIPANPETRERNNLYTKEHFEACRIHLEFKVPYEPYNRFQHRANSGVFFQNTYEVQILDSYGNTGSWDDVGAIYKVSPPRVNASFPPGEWQTLDVEYHPAEFNLGGTLVALPKITVYLNGVMVQKDQTITSQTSHGWKGRQPEPEYVTGPVWLQDHGHQISFRNIWIQKL